MTDRVYDIRVSTRGRITVPAAIRKSLGIRGGEAARFEPQPEGSLAIIVDERAKP